MNPEIRGLVMLAIRNAFYKDYSALVNQYLKLAEGFGTSQLKTDLNHLSNVFSRNTTHEGRHNLNLFTKNRDGHYTSHETFLAALNHDPASQILINEDITFERTTNGDWRFYETPSP